ncbi:hypothetical protein DAEQUDRAFT_116157 [Daedalea quercina L-15889]|uniref:Uncharacterized protein n=1 Tax=Daedalea quercina L-15889 TaxID=1314783 RepID=A0A165KTI9_9APHY|nr:hypothetical protein DAEQUDRAFT_116157 [Daedalea quercina L-15889]
MTSGGSGCVGAIGRGLRVGVAGSKARVAAGKARVAAGRPAQAERRAGVPYCAVVSMWAACFAAICGTWNTYEVSFAEEPPVSQLGRGSVWHIWWSARVKSHAISPRYTSFLLRRAVRCDMPHNPTFLPWNCCIVVARVPFRHIHGRLGLSGCVSVDSLPIDAPFHCISCTVNPPSYHTGQYMKEPARRPDIPPHEGTRCSDDWSRCTGGTVRDSLV